MVFDKTGTLTKGKLQITDIYNLPQPNKYFAYSKNDILQIASSLEKNSEHPLGQAIYNYGLT